MQLSEIDGTKHMTPQKRFILYIVLNNPRLPTQTVADHGGYTKSHASELLRDLKRDGYLENAPNPVEPRGSVWLPAEDDDSERARLEAKAKANAD